MATELPSLLALELGGGNASPPLITFVTLLIDGSDLLHAMPEPAVLGSGEKLQVQEAIEPAKYAKPAKPDRVVGAAAARLFGGGGAEVSEKRAVDDVSKAGEEAGEEVPKAVDESDNRTVTVKKPARGKKKLGLDLGPAPSVRRFASLARGAGRAKHSTALLFVSSNIFLNRSSRAGGRGGAWGEEEQCCGRRQHHGRGANSCGGRESGRHTGGRPQRL